MGEAILDFRKRQDSNRDLLRFFLDRKIDSVIQPLHPHRKQEWTSFASRPTLQPYITISTSISLIPYGNPYSAIFSMNGNGSNASGPKTPAPFQ